MQRRNGLVLNGMSLCGASTMALSRERNTLLVCYVSNITVHDLVLTYCAGLSPSPSAGSFIRSSRKSDSERTFLEAVRQKYASDDTDKPIAVALDQQIEISGKVVEEVGFDKIRQQLAQLHELKIVIVDGMRIKKADEKKDDIAKTCPLIVELDLSRNLFQNLDEVGLISQQLEHLRVLKLK